MYFYQTNEPLQEYSKVLINVLFLSVLSKYSSTGMSTYGSLKKVLEYEYWVL